VIRYRAVLEQAAFDRPSTTTALSAALGRTQLVRVVERAPCKLVVADRSMALTPLLPRDAGPAGAEPTSVVVRAPGIVEALLTLFGAVRHRPVHCCCRHRARWRRIRGPRVRTIPISSCCP
jgi:hypothetical protein